MANLKQISRTKLPTIAASVLALLMVSGCYEELETGYGPPPVRHQSDADDRAIAEGIRELEEGGRELERGGRELERGGRELERGGRELERGGEELEEGGRELEDAGRELDTGPE